MRRPSVYISHGGRPGGLSIGVTSGISQHQWRTRPAASGPSGAPYLLWAESHDSMDAAVARADELGRWPRIWLLRLVLIALEQKPFWHDWPARRHDPT